MFANNYAKQQGFTLIELIAGIVILAVAMTALTSIVYPQATKSIDPVYQVRAAELAQSLMNEVVGKAFDENTDYSSGTRCNELTAVCTITALLGPDTGEVTASNYDDVDDYHGYNQAMAQLDNANLYSTLYKGFTFNITVIYDGNYDGVADNNQVAKRVDISVTTPANQTYKFAVYKANY